MCTYLPIDYAAMFIFASSNKTRFLQNLIYKINTQKTHKQVVNIYKVTTNLIYVSSQEAIIKHQNQVLYVHAESQ